MRATRFRRFCLALPLCAWVALVPILALESRPDGFEPSYGLTVEQSCSVPVATLRICAASCGTAPKFPENLPDDARVRVCCTVRIGIPQILLLDVAGDDFSPSLQSAVVSRASEPAVFAQPPRPLVPPPQSPPFA